MASTFEERFDALEEMIGHGHVVASCEVNQVYAHFQHEGLDLNHPRGGQAKYLEQPWEGAADRFTERLAREILTPGGLRQAASAIAEDGSSMVGVHAPVEFNDLRRSGHPKVTHDGAVIYDRPPEVPRLSEAQLRAKGRA